MDQKTSQERSQPLVPAQEVRPGSVLARKRLLALLGIGCVLFLVAASPYVIRAARAEWERLTVSNNAPLPAPPAKVSPTVTKPTTMAPPAQQPTVSAEEQAQKLWTEFEKTTWASPLDAWSSLHPNIPCKSFRGNMWGGGADRQWSQRCATSQEAEAAHWSFYVFGMQEPLVPLLEQFDVSTLTLPFETLTAVQSSLQGRLTARFGPGEDRSPKVAVIRPVPWPQYQHWQTADVEIQLNLSEFDPQRKEGRLQFQARHRTLLEALKEDERLRLVGATSFWYETGSGVDKQLADDLRPDFPEVATFLVKQQPDPDPEKVREAFQKLQSQLRSSQATGQAGPRGAIVAIASPPTHWKAGEFHDALVKLLASVKSSPRERQPVLLMAADRLAWRLPQVMTDDKSSNGEWSEWRAQLAKFGVIYQESAVSPAENAWTYNGSLLQRVWTEYADTDWGERAFLVLLLHGWDTGVDCAAGTDQFGAVIQRGLEFQEKHPKSPYLLDVKLAVAQAYETWWSLSQAPTGEEVSEVDADVQPAKYREGAEAARQKAIASYEEFLQTAPQSDNAAYARRVLPRLKLALDTGQRRFYCSLAD